MYVCADCAAPTDVWQPHRVMGAADLRCVACGGPGDYYCSTPIACIKCRAVDPNPTLHNNNHAGYIHHWGVCTSQWLRRNQLRFMVQRPPAEGISVPAKAADNIREYRQRFLDAWQWMPRTDWQPEIDAADARIRELERVLDAPEHHGVPDSVDAELF